MTPWYCELPRLPRVLKARILRIGRGCRRPDALVDERRAGFVDVRQIVEFPAARPVVLDRAGHSGEQLLLKGHAIEVGIGGLDVLIDVPQAARRESVFVTPATPANGPPLSV